MIIFQNNKKYITITDHIKIKNLVVGNKLKIE